MLKKLLVLGSLVSAISLSGVVVWAQTTDQPTQPQNQQGTPGGAPQTGAGGIYK